MPGGHSGLSTASRICAGQSMAPTIKIGDAVEIAICARYRAGEVVVFGRSGGDYEVVHRIVCKLPFAPYFVHRGDAPESRVGLARCDHVLGRVALPRRRPRLRDLAAGFLLALRTGIARLGRLSS